MGRRTQSIVSTLLMITSVALLVIVGVLYIRDRDDSSDPVPPTAMPGGHNQAINVLEAFRAQDLDAEFGEQGTDVRSTVLERPGQMIELENGRAYVFIYPDTFTRDDTLLDLLPEDVDLIDISGDEVAYDSIELYAGSNIAVVLVDSDEETAEKVRSAVEGLT